MRQKWSEGYDTENAVFELIKHEQYQERLAYIKGSKGDSPGRFNKKQARKAESPSDFRSAQSKALLIALGANKIGRSTPNATSIPFPLNQEIKLAYASILSPPLTAYMCQAANKERRASGKSSSGE